MDAPAPAAAHAPARPRGTLARCAFAWVTGGLTLASVVAFAVSWGIGALSAKTAGMSEWLLEAAWQAYLASWIGVVAFTPLAAVASAVVGGRQGRTAAYGGGVWLVLLALQSVAARAGEALAGSAVFEWVYGALLALLMGVVPFAIAAATVFAGAWRWRYGPLAAPGRE